MSSRIFFNIHAQRVPDVAYLLSLARDMQPTWALVMDGLGLAKQIKAAVPSCNVIHRAWPDEEIYKTVTPKDWVAMKKAEIGGADVWCYTVNEMGYGDQLLQWFIDVIKEAAKVSLKVIIGNMSVGTPQPEEWNKPLSIELLKTLNANRNNAVLAVHEYACAVITSGFYGGYPDNAGVPPGQPGGVNLIPPANWPEDTHSITRWHMGRAATFMFPVCSANHIPLPRMIATEWGFDDVSDIKAWTQTLMMTPPYHDIRGWKSIKNQWASWYPTWTQDQAYFEQLAYADQSIYQNTPFEAQLIFCWGHSSAMWDQFDVAQATELHGLLKQYAANGNNGGNEGGQPVGKVDLKLYMTGNTVYELGHNQAMGGGTELLQTQGEAADPRIFRYVKQGGAATWSLWERLCATDSYIYRDLDTSPAPNQAYRLKDEGLQGWSKWCPRWMAVGDRYRRAPIVIFLYKDSGQPVPSKPPYKDVSDIVLEAVMSSYTIPENGITLQNVVRLAFYPVGASTWTERYYYGQGYGLVAWENNNGNRSYVSVAHSPHPAPKPEVLGAWANPPPIPADTVPPQPQPEPPPAKPSNAADPVTLIVISPYNLRQEPDSSAKQIGVLKAGEQIKAYRIPETNNDNFLWHFIERTLTPAGESNQGYTAVPLPVPEPPDPEPPAEPIVFNMNVEIVVPGDADVEAIKAALESITALRFKS